MIRSSPWFTRIRTSVPFAERLSHFGGDQLGIAFVAIWPLCKCLRAQKTWDLKFPYNRIRAKHVEVATPSSSCRSTAFVQPSFCVGCATQKLLIRCRCGSPDRQVGDPGSPSQIRTTSGQPPLVAARRPRYGLRMTPSPPGKPRRAQHPAVSHTTPTSQLRRL